MHVKLSTAFLSLCLGAQAILSRDADDVVSIPVPATAPSNTSQVDPSFAGFAFEERSFYIFFGPPSNPKNLSLNLLRTITEATGTVPHIRVGGTSLDNSQYNASQTKPITVPDGEKGKSIPKNMTLGPSYFDAFATIPNAKYVIDIPMKKGNLQNSKLFAKAAYQKVGASNIEALEIGNEPNNYDKSKDAYIKQWSNWSSEISTALGLGEDDKIYQAVAMGSETGGTGFPGGTSDSWKIPDIFKEGLIDDKPRIKQVSMHYYQSAGKNTSDLQSDIMNHTAVVKGSAFVRNAIKYLTNHSVGDLVLGEVGSLLGNGSANNTVLEADLGAALWQADFYMYSMSIGVKRINWQSGFFPFSLWNPEYTKNKTTVPASVHAAFYGHLFAAEFIGKASTVGVHNIDLNRPFLSAYSAYDNGKLGRIAIVNFEAWSKGDSPSRPSKNVTLNLTSSTSSVKVKRLTSKQGALAGPENMTWKGKQWSAENGGDAQLLLNDTETLPVAGGTVNIAVKASEAVMVFV